MNETKISDHSRLPLSYKLRWWLYYHAKTQKGRFEVRHFLVWLFCMALAIGILEGAVLVWRQG